MPSFPSIHRASSVSPLEDNWQLPTGGVGGGVGNSCFSMTAQEMNIGSNARIRMVYRHLYCHFLKNELFFCRIVMVVEKKIGSYFIKQQF